MRNYKSTVSEMIKDLFKWATIYGGEVRLAVPMLFALGFLFLFTVGGLTGVMLSNASIDVAFHDTNILNNIISYISITNLCLYNLHLYNTYNNNISHYTNDYIEQYFVGLLEGNGNIIVDYINDKKKRIKIVIKLINVDENKQMINILIKYIGGKIVYNNKYISLVISNRSDLTKVFMILAKYPLLTTNKLCQLDYAKLFINDYTNISKDEFIKLTHNKYNKQSYLLSIFNNKFTTPYYFPGWLSGFIESQGQFKLTNSQFIINFNELYIINAINLYFNINNTNNVIINKHNISILNKHLESYPLLGYKNTQYKKWLNSF